MQLGSSNDTEMFHEESWDQKSKVKVTSHKKHCRRGPLHVLFWVFDLIFLVSRALYYELLVSKALRCYT